MNTEPLLSIVVGVQDPGDKAAECVRALTAQSREHPVEVIVAQTDEGDVGSDEPEITLVSGPRGSLVPELWGLGIRRARGSWVGIMTSHCVPDPSWIDNALALIRDSSHAGIGGVIDAPVRGTMIDWALFFARYSAYMPPVEAGLVDEIPGDNALYRRTVLERCWSQPEQGFWEPLVHRAMRREGETLAMVPGLVVRVGRSHNVSRHFTQRLRHGFHFGSTRPGSRPVRLARLATAPLLPVVFLVRIGRRVVRRRPGLWLRFLASLPWLLAIFIAWSLGEAVGYLFPVESR